MTKIITDKKQGTLTSFLSMIAAYHGSHVVKIFLACVAILFIATTNAYAYIDPGSGALIWQLLPAVLFGAIFYIRVVKLRILKIINWTWSKIVGKKGE